MTNLVLLVAGVLAAFAPDARVAHPAERPLDHLWVLQTLQGKRIIERGMDVATVRINPDRTVVDWRANRTAHAGFVLDALEQALHDRRPVHRGGLMHDSDRGSQYVSIKYTERLAEAGIKPSVGSVGDSYDCESMWAVWEVRPELTIDHVSWR